MTQAEPHEYLFTSESVTEGHPDKIADAVSDAVLDAALANDPYSRMNWPRPGMRCTSAFAT